MGGYSLHLYCAGQGSPTVLLEAGLGGGVVTWPLVQPEVAAATRVCSYDRSGWAWSDGAPAESGQETANRLHSLLVNAGEKGPYILVGHSLGGLYNQLFAAAFPSEVAGMVFVEGRHQDFVRHLPHDAQKSAYTLSFMNRVVAPGAVRVGLARLLVSRGGLPGVPANLPPGWAAISLRPVSQATAATEFSHLQSVEDEVRAAHLTLGDKPLVVVTRDQSTASGSDSQAWFDTQKLYLTLSTRSRLIEARGSSHNVPYDAPATVTEAIRDVVNAARR